ncbi:MAG TPA: hypothetical protein VKS21_00375 [Spirochaetota bacterium]|nr:hypothetical protein [Spirochaetota bacterium]
MKRLILNIICILFIIACATPTQMGTVWQGTKKFIEADTKPKNIFTAKTIKSVSVMQFDAKGVKTLQGQIIDYMALGDTFTDDLIRTFYENGKIKVTVGEYVEEMALTDEVEKKVGDVNIKRSLAKSVVKYKAAPFRKVDALLSGRIVLFEKEKPFEKSYIEVYLKLTDTYDGTVFWITRIRGFYGNVINTIVSTIESGEYNEISKKYEKE